jgi:hypothetical protein
MTKQSKHAIQFNDGEIQPWMIDGKTAGIHTFAETMALASLEGKSIRLSANMQKTLLGYAVFGKQSFTVLDGKVTVCVKQAFGFDWDEFTVFLPQVADAISRKLVVHATRQGKGYYSTHGTGWSK